jgi:hypothetical protein
LNPEQQPGQNSVLEHDRLHESKETTEDKRNPYVVLDKGQVSGVEVRHKISIEAKDESTEK